ncbi:MAG: hypothetical protein QXP57_02615 [Nitrososphaerota archaeon]
MLKKMLMGYMENIRLETISVEEKIILASKQINKIWLKVVL